MCSQNPLGPTLAYLRFPLRVEHRGGLCDGSRCPHCCGTGIQKWGRFAGRQRFRCRTCRRTFSTFTGTPLRYLKRPDRWRAFLWCMEGRLTVRGSGTLVGIDKNTALRWRHRVLDHWRQAPHRGLRGSIAVGEFWMPLNEKGSRRLARRPRRHGHAPGRRRDDASRVGVIAVIETEGDAAPELWVGCSDVRVLGQTDYPRLLGPRLGHVHEIAGCRGPLCTLARFAGREGVAYRKERSGLLPERVSRLCVELRSWLRPFCGVATHRLDNYLEWFRRDGIGGRWREGRPAGSQPNRSRRQSHRDADPIRSTTRLRTRSRAGSRPVHEGVQDPGTTWFRAFPSAGFFATPARFDRRPSLIR